jgi:nitroreductase
MDTTIKAAARGDVDEAVRSLLQTATRAPSSHNTQPWCFHVAGSQIVLLADRTRALPVNDPDDRELVMSCGCALLFLQVAAAASGRSAIVETRRANDPPLGDDVDVLARITLGDGPADRALAKLAPAISIRRTCRDAFDDGQLPPGLSARLEAAAAVEGVSFVLVDAGADRSRLSDLVAEGDRALFADRRWRRELASWMHPRRDVDGLVVGTSARAAAMRAAVTHLNVGRHTAAHDRELAAAAPLLGILATERDDVPAWLAAGQALAHVLLTATRSGVAAGFLNQPCQADSVRPALAELAGPCPQAVLRLGVPLEPIAATPRRTVDATLL